MELDSVRRRFEPAIRRGLHLYWRFARGLTLGVPLTEFHGVLRGVPTLANQKGENLLQEGGA